MSPTTDDLRALLEQRAGDPPAGLVQDGATGTRLAGVRQRIRRRRQARLTAVALSLALLGGSAAAVTAHLHGRTGAIQPAHLPPVDGAGRRLAAKLTGEGVGVHFQTAALAPGWADLHLVAGCTGGDAVSAVVLLDGRAVGQEPCTGGTVDVTVTRAQASSWGLAPDTAVATVGLHLGRTPAAGAAPVLDQWAVLPTAHGILGAYSSARRLPGAEPRAVDEGAGRTDPGGDTHLVGVTLPVTRDAGTTNLVVVPGRSALLGDLSCGTATAADAFGVVITVNGRPDVAVPCDASGDRRDDGFGYPEPSSAAEAGISGGRPTTVIVRFVRLPAKPARTLTLTDLTAAPGLTRDVPDGRFTLGLTGAPYLGGPPAPIVRVTAPVDETFQGARHALTLVAQPGRPAAAVVRVRSGEVTGVLRCVGSVTATARMRPDGRGTGPNPCDPDAAWPLSVPGAGIRTITVSVGGSGDVTAGTARYALYGDVDVLAVLQPGVVPLPDGSFPATPTVPSPDVALDGTSVPQPRIAELTVAEGHHLTISVRSSDPWGWQLACTTPSGTAAVSLDGTATGVTCASKAFARDGRDAHTLTLTAGPGSGGAGLAVVGTPGTVVELVSGS